MAARVTQVEKELMWKLYQKCGSIKEVAKKVKRDRSTVSRYVHEFEAALSAAGYILNSKEKEV